MRTSFRSINGRILLVPVIALMALIVSGLISIRTIGHVTLIEHQARARAVAEAATKIVEHFEELAAKGAMPDDAAQTAAKEVLRAIRYDGNEYVIARGIDGIITVNGLFPAREGSASKDDKDANGTYFARDMIKAAQAGGGFNYYMWPKKPNTPPLRKVTYSKLSGRWKWVIGSGVYLDEVDAATWDNAVRTGAIIGVMALLTFGCALWLGRRITVPILALVGVTRRLADGDLSVAVVGSERRDEIGSMAQAIAVLKERSADAQRLAAEQEALKAQAAAEQKAALNELADTFERNLGGIVDGVAAAATEMEGTAGAMSETAEQAKQQATTVSAATAEASANVQTVASASEELAASIAEIGRQVAQSATIAQEAVGQADRTNASVEELASAAQKIGEVVTLIQTIAGQTNLLALNATIEAARAGEHGKGFAVVASEVKSLAMQTAKATEEISSQIQAIQGATGEAVTAIRAIGTTIGQINEIATTIASAVEEQGAATREIAGNVQQAAEGTNEVARNIDGMTQASEAVGTAASQVLGSAGELSRQSEQLKQEVETFLASVRAA